jgi:hypothetical protein
MIQTKCWGFEALPGWKKHASWPLGQVTASPAAAARPTHHQEACRGVPSPIGVWMKGGGCPSYINQRYSKLTNSIFILNKKIVFTLYAKKQLKSVYLFRWKLPIQPLFKGVMGEKIIVYLPVLSVVYRLLKWWGFRWTVKCPPKADNCRNQVITMPPWILIDLIPVSLRADKSRGVLDTCMAPTRQYII